MINEYIELIKSKGIDFENYEKQFDVEDGISDYLENWKKRVLYIENTFDSEFYLNCYEDVLLSDFNPLVHYILFGENEGREAFDSKTKQKDNYKDFISSIFSEKHYKTLEVDEGFFEHFYKHGRFDNWRTPNELVDLDFIKFKLENKKLEIKSGDLFYEAFRENKHSNSVPYSDTVERMSVIYNIDYNESMFKLIQISELTGISKKSELDIFISLFFLSDIENLKDSVAQSLANCLYFDPKVYSRNANIEFSNELSLFKHWLDNLNIIPTSFFNIDIYREENKDLSGTDIELFIHFLLNGQYEGRVHNIFFSYIDENIPNNVSKPLQVMKNSLEDYFTTETRIFIKNNFPNSSLGYTDWLLLQEINSELFKFSVNREAQKLFWVMFDLKELMFQLDTNTFKETVNKCKVNEWNVDFSPFFSSEYLHSFLDGELNSLELFSLFYEKRHDFDCSPLFCSSFYLENNADLLNYDGSLIEHFFYHGIFENRKPSIFLDLQWINFVYNSPVKSAAQVFFEHERSNSHIKPNPCTAPLFNSEFRRLIDYSLYLYKNENFFNKYDEIYAQIEEISLVEPLIKPTFPELPISFMPFNVDNYAYLRELPSLIGKADILIFRDSINFGGADSVLSFLFNALDNLFPNKVIKIISLGKVSNEAMKIHDLDPVKVIDLYNEIIKYCHDIHLPALLPDLIYDIIVGTESKVIFNVNCGALWQSLEKFGKQLHTQSKFYSYLFCNDRDEYGNIDGYPSRHFVNTLAWNDIFFVDSKVLQTDLIKQCNNSKYVENKIQLLETPIPDSEKHIEKYALRGSSNKCIVWAGRFDEQKRPDILIKIAKKMPDFQFYAWGKSVLGSNKHDFSEAKNIKLMGLFEDIEEILNVKPALFLYTSEWDGVPTILLKLISIGLPVVASNVGGVSEVVEKNYLVNNIENENEYLERILYAINSDKQKLIDFNLNILKGRNTKNYTTQLSKKLYEF